MTHKKMTNITSGSHRVCFLLGLHSEALPSSWGFQWHNVKARSTEVGLEEGIKEENAARGGDDGKLHPDGSNGGWTHTRMNKCQLRYLEK